MYTVDSAMAAHARFKERWPDRILVIRLGDYYETFGDDAEMVARVCNLTLTRRRDSTPLAGFPAHMKERCILQLIRAGQRVAVADKADDQAALA